MKEILFELNNWLTEIRIRKIQLEAEKIRKKEDLNLLEDNFAKQNILRKGPTYLSVKLNQNRIKKEIYCIQCKINNLVSSEETVKYFINKIEAIYESIKYYLKEKEGAQFVLSYESYEEIMNILHYLKIIMLLSLSFKNTSDRNEKNIELDTIYQTQEKKLEDLKNYVWGNGLLVGKKLDLAWIDLNINYPKEEVLNHHLLYSENNYNLMQAPEYQSFLKIFLTAAEKEWTYLEYKYVCNLRKIFMDAKYQAKELVIKAQENEEEDLKYNPTRILKSHPEFIVLFENETLLEIKQNLLEEARRLSVKKNYLEKKDCFENIRYISDEIKLRKEKKVI